MHGDCCCTSSCARCIGNCGACYLCLLWRQILCQRLDEVGTLLDVDVLQDMLLIGKDVLANKGEGEYILCTSMQLSAWRGSDMEHPQHAPCAAHQFRQWPLWWWAHSHCTMHTTRKRCHSTVLQAHSKAETVLSVALILPLGIIGGKHTCKDGRASGLRWMSLWMSSFMSSL